MSKRIVSPLAQLLAALVFATLPLEQALSVPEPLPSAPMFLSNNVEPNIFLTLDDSGSMDFGPIMENNTGGIPMMDGAPLTTYQAPYCSWMCWQNATWEQILTNYHPTWNSVWNLAYPQHAGAIPPSNGTKTDWDKYWIARTHHGNKNYYNPAIKYMPWPGLKTNGSRMYLDANPKWALQDPNLPLPGGQSTNLESRLDFQAKGNGAHLYSRSLYLPTYFIWHDTDGDGVIEQSDDRTMVEIQPGTDEMQNFANWFVYYRSRINATKSAIGRVIDNTNFARMGYAGMNQELKKSLASLSDAANKHALLDSFYKFTIKANPTPGRSALKRTGEWFRTEKDGRFILSEEEGGACQQNFNILMTDGYWSTQDTAGFGNYDADNNTAYDGNASQSNDGGNYADQSADILGDIAMHYYETDLRPDLPNDVPVTEGVDEAPHQHLVNYSIGFGVKGTLDPETQHPTDPGFAWPLDVHLSEPRKIDDLWHAAYNSRGKMLSASSPDELYESLQAIVSNIADRTGSAAAISVNSGELSTESTAYVGAFDSQRWHGSLSAYKIIDTKTGAFSTNPEWEAAEKLDNRDRLLKPRTIITVKNSKNKNEGIPFRWEELSKGMKNDLEEAATRTSGKDKNGTVEELAKARLDYIRGDRSNEGTGYGYRIRASRLGDLINSSPVYVGKPEINWPGVTPFPTGDNSYAHFKIDQKNRQTMVYVGANDGMLHGFDAETGVEELAYIPGALYSSKENRGLHYLTDAGYIHQYYVDLTPSASDVYISSGSGNKWHSVLIGGLRAGGRGIFALDVTNPGSFSENNAEDIVLWEFTDKDDEDLGYTYSRPYIALTNLGIWAAIFGNGYNSTSSTESALFLLSIERGIDGTWGPGDSMKFKTGAKGTDREPNGLGTPALVDLDGNGTVDRAYAGDLLGNMWVFDLESEDANDWKSAYGTKNAPLPLFTTPPNADGDPTPITAKPVLARHPTQPSTDSNTPNIMVFFGSGQYLWETDKANNRVNAFYGVWDKGDGELKQDDLIEQTFDPGYAPDLVLTRNWVDYQEDHGWYFELPDSGERSITPPIARAGTVFFNSFVSQDSVCAWGGYGYRYAVDMATGGSPLKPVVDSNNDGVIDNQDYVTNGAAQSTVAATGEEGFLPEPVFIEDLVYTGETALKVKALIKVVVGQISWQELLE